MRRLGIWGVLLMVIGLQSCIKDAKSVLEKAEMATFIIYTYDDNGSPAGSGSGFFIEKDGTGITNYHVLDKSTKAVIRLKDGKVYEIDKVLASDKKWDIVKFSIRNVDGADFDYLEFSNKDVEQGDKVYNLGAPMGLEQTFSDGLISSIRSDSHGKIIQVSIPISQGSSGSPIMNESGEVIAVASFKSMKGENLNFGVQINDELLSQMKSNPFQKDNRHFNKNENFIIINLPSDRQNNLSLNAIQFKKDVTIAYLSYTNLDMSNSGSGIWCKTNEGDNGFYIKNRETGEKKYIVSSTIGSSREEGTTVPLATVCKFQINFPPIDNSISRIDICEGDDPEWSFSDINLDDYRKIEKIEFDNYKREYAYSTMREGDLDFSKSLFEEMLENDPENLQILNVLGIISFVQDNNKDAIDYFSSAIEEHPNSVVSYLNRSCVYRNQDNNKKALSDLDKAISIDNNKPELYIERADVYMEMKEWEKAKKDYDMILTFKDFKDDYSIYYLRGACFSQLDDTSNAINDLKNAYKYASSSETKQMIIETMHKISPPTNTYDDSTVTAYFKGAIGQYPIVMCFKLRKGDSRVTGWYYYESKGPNNPLRIEGIHAGNGNFILEEFDSRGTQTGKFDGSYSDGVYSGSYYSFANSRYYNFKLNQY